MNYPIRHIALFAAAAALVGAVFLGAGSLLRPDLSRPPPSRTQEEIAEVEALRDVTIDYENLPAVARNVDYTAGRDAAWYPKGESPLLRELAEEGELPPVADRVGAEPLVMRGPDGIGAYGGTWYRVANSKEDVTIINGMMSGATLVRWSPLGRPIVPHVAKGWDVSPDQREYTFYLRNGMRWSDGHPFTADDIVFWWDKDVNYFTGYPRWMTIRGEPGRIEKIDDFTVKYIFPHPNPLFLEQLANANTWAHPAHYLAAYHPESGDPELIRRTMESLSLGSPIAVFLHVKTVWNPDYPRLWPWVYRSHQTSPPYRFVRNPYFWAVDDEGNQLPYVDQVVFGLKGAEQIAVSAASGEITMQALHIRYEDYTLLMGERESGGYEVYHWYPTTRSVFTVFPNLNRRIDPQRPATRLKHALLNDVRFRKALSLAVQREEIIEAQYNGQGEPAQLDPGPDSPFHNPRLFKSFTQYDPAEANRLLDELGLTNRDREGYRTFADGARMVFYLNVTDHTGSGPAPFLIEDWADVGIRVVLRERARSLFFVEKNAYEHELSVWTGESEFYPLLEPRNFVPTHQVAFYAPGYGVWYQDGGLRGTTLSTAARAIEPPRDHPLRKAMVLLDEARVAPTEEERRRIFDDILDIAAENVWTISISTPPPQLVIVKAGFRNVPRNALWGTRFGSPAIAGIETFYFESPTTTAGIDAQIRRLMVETIPDPAIVAAAEPGVPGRGRGLGRLVRLLVWGGVLATLVLVAVRHPYIGRRLMIMAPTLLIISIVSFVIIQLPPGDYLSARITELEMLGDFGALQVIEDMKEMFHYDEPAVQRYARWLGLYWFAGFDRADTGLLQGNLGRSMEDGRRVNDIVGDRLILTILISLFTILFTWAFALPAGIYSAVRQYSVTDYLVTLVGFIGMCIPGFLLALVLGYASHRWFGFSVTGLFSAEYAAQPDWSWAKFVDLLRHIWVPVVVLGVGGTAGMIRVMRANLLDELRKPYVITARAKGVRPVKLLLKYPVRLALNPFISGIGGLFPQLVSGGAIVAMVLSLPTVGPLMLSALMNEDMYLAGSMLMVLSLLGVLGTLVSDLLLLLLDPRIRFAGGTR